MKVKITAKEVLKPALSLFVFCLVMTLLLAGTNLLTKDMIKEQELKTEETARKVVFASADSFEAKDGYFLALKDGETIGYIFTTEADSYGGALKVMTGISEAGKVTGVSILSIDDTPGLGMNAKNESFRGQYLQDVPAAGFEVVTGGGAGEGEINALTGATITSMAVTTAVNEAVSQFNNLKAGD